MTLEEIKQAVDEGQIVCWKTDSYQVIKDHIGQYLIQHTNGSCIGLTWRDGVTMNEDPKDFYIVSI